MSRFFFSLVNTSDIFYDVTKITRSLRITSVQEKKIECRGSEKGLEGVIEKKMFNLLFLNSITLSDSTSLNSLP